MQIAAGAFQAHGLGLMDEVQRTHLTYTITKRGKPVARLVPIDDVAEPIFGFLKGHATLKDDLIAPTGERWNVDA